MLGSAINNDITKYFPQLFYLKCVCMCVYNNGCGCGRGEDGRGSLSDDFSSSAQWIPIIQLIDEDSQTYRYISISELYYNFILPYSKNRIEMETACAGLQAKLFK